MSDGKGAKREIGSSWFGGILGIILIRWGTLRELESSSADSMSVNYL